MIDLHCHYLPAIDDGAPTVSAALELARAAVADGVHTAVLTPHVFPGRWSHNLTSLKPHYKVFKEQLKQQGIALRVMLGAEVRLLPETMQMCSDEELPFLGRWGRFRVLLLELPDGQVPVGSLNAVNFFVERKIIPLIAHPERNRAVMRSPQILQPFIEAGCLLQITAASVIGGFGRHAQKCALDLLERGWVTVVASDAHNMDHRPPMMTPARDAIAKRFGADAARALTLTNAAEIIEARGSYRVG